MKNSNFPYFVGIKSLEEIATKENRVVIFNILGNESSKVTPVSHAFSGGNVVAGIQYGRSGVLETPIGDIPVYPRLAEVVQNHNFDTGVIYLPPTAVFYAVTELLRYKRYGDINLKKIVIVTEKISVKDQRMIRAVCQRDEVDVFGANALGIADSWNHVRIGGALGGDSPQETLIKGSVAIHSNSGNFGNTIAEYMKTEGFGTTAIVSSGKDVIIQFAAAEFLNAANNDPRTKAAVLYVEPGGFYEKQALDWLKAGTMKFDKPIVVCVTGRWKSRINRAVGHAGALAGSNDDAISKENWFDDYFGCRAFDVNKPDEVGEKGVRVVSIQHIPVALKAIYKKLGMQPDFAPKGNLSLKPWMGNDMGIHLPPNLSLGIVKAIEPYGTEIEKSRELGAVFLRERMRNASSATKINEKTQIAEIHDFPVTELIDIPMESNMIFALTKKHPSRKDLKLLNISLNRLAKVDVDILRAVKFSERSGATPNQALMTATSMLGDNEMMKLSRSYTSSLLDLFVELGIKEAVHGLDYSLTEPIAEKFIKTGGQQPTAFSIHLADEILKTYGSSTVLGSAAIFTKNHLLENHDVFLVSAVLLHFSLPALVLKKISRQRAEDMFGLVYSQMQMLRCMGEMQVDLPMVKAIDGYENFVEYENSVTKLAYNLIFEEEPSTEYLMELNTLVGLTITNGPGTISAKGAKESVSARNNLSTTFSGFLSNTGLAHGGSGFEAVEFLLDSFKNHDLKSPTEYDGNLKDIANEVSIKYLEFKIKAKKEGVMNYKRIPCVNHPVFKGKLVNIDPREDFIRSKFGNLGINNVFWDYYHHLVESLYENGVSNNVYCVNIDAVIAVISLKLMWGGLKSGRFTDMQVQKIGFVIFLIGRMIGVSAEIADHLERGTDMDCRTPQSELKFIV